MAIDDTTNGRPTSIRGVEYLGLLATTLLALGLRLFGRGNESIWYDEAYSLEMAQASCADLITGQVADPGNPAGYFLVLRAWLECWESASIETARALSGLVGALGVPAVWLLARAAGATPATRLLACLLVAVDPPLVYLGQEARAFALFATLATLATATALAIERDDRWWGWLGFTLAGALMVHVHYYAFFVLVVLGLDLLVWGFRSGWTKVGKLTLSAVMVALAFAPYVPTFLWQLGHGASRSVSTWWQHLAVLPSFSIVGRTLAWKLDGFYWVIALDLLVIVGIFVPLAWMLLRYRTWPRLLVSFALGLPLLVLIVAMKAPMIHTHYLSVLFPTVMLLLAWGLVSARAYRPWLVGGVAVLVTVLMAASLARMYLTRHKTDWRGVADVVAKDGPALPVFFYEDIGETPFRYYRPDQVHEVIRERAGVDGAGWRPNVLPKLIDAPQGCWLVLYLTHDDTREELPGMHKLLRESLEIEEMDFREIIVWRCRPRRSDHAK